MESSADGDEDGQAITFDPVCGKRVERALASSSTIHGDRKYSFCSDSCRSTFELDPEHYLADGGAGAAEASSSSGMG